ncbi:hypothetical protein LSAT2_023629 [Lamellibrachia satsuma]|nr:hypothetical protein LSAT2_023629 [Lamellibrachia satsuma]
MNHLESGGFPVGAIIAICVTGTLVLCLVILLVWLVNKKNAKKSVGTADYCNNSSPANLSETPQHKHIVSGVYWSDKQSNYVNNSASPPPKRLPDNFTGEYDRPRSKQEVVTPITSRDIATGGNNDFITVE